MKHVISCCCALAACNAPPGEGKRVDKLGTANVLNGYIYMALDQGAMTFHLGDGYSGATLPCVGDFDGDGNDSVALYDTKEATFLMQDQNTGEAPIRTIAFGKPNNWPVCGDFDGDGTDTIGVYDLSTGEFQLRDENSEGPADRVLSPGFRGVPIVGDFDGDGTDTVGVFDPTTATFQLVDGESFVFGKAGDSPFVGDFDGDGIDTVGAFDGKTGEARLRDGQSLVMPIMDAGVAAVPPIHFPFAGRWKDSGARAEAEGYAWPTSGPEAENIDLAALTSVYTKARGLPRLHSLLVVRHGKLVAEEYFHGATRGMSNNVQSCSKSMLSLLYGVAYDQHRWVAGTPAQQVLPHLGTDPERQKILIEHLLTMSAGLSWSEVYPLNDFGNAPDPLLYVWQKPIEAAPGQKFLYSTGLAYVTGAVLQQIVGERLDRYARRELFDKLGVKLHDWIRLGGVPHGGSAMHFLPRDMARIGEMVLHRGALDGVQLVSSAWIDGSTSPVISAASDSPYDFYGALWWVIDINGTRIISARGFGGQFIFIVPSLDAVIVATSVWYTNGAESDQSYTDALSLILRDVLPTIRP